MNTVFMHRSEMHCCVFLERRASCLFGMRGMSMAGWDRTDGMTSRNGRAICSPCIAWRRSACGSPPPAGTWSAGRAAAPPSSPRIGAPSGFSGPAPGWTGSCSGPAGKATRVTFTLFFFPLPGASDLGERGRGYLLQQLPQLLGAGVPGAHGLLGRHHGAHAPPLAVLARAVHLPRLLRVGRQHLKSGRKRGGGAAEWLLL